MKPQDIVVGATYRMLPAGTRKYRTVVSFDPDDWKMPGGVVRIHSGKTKTGRDSQVETCCGEWFADRAIERVDPETGERMKEAG